jgi:hypothetical protein
MADNEAGFSASAHERLHGLRNSSPTLLSHPGGNLHSLAQEKSGAESAYLLQQPA